MIVQRFEIAKYNWRVTVYYAVTCYWAVEIVRALLKIGCQGNNLADARANLLSCNLNTGLTYSNHYLRETVMVLALTSTPAQFQNSLDHEKGHLAKHIAQAYDLDPFGEELQYLAGEIGQKMFPVAKKFLCECCRKKLKRI